MLKTFQACALLVAIAPLPTSASPAVVSTVDRLALHHQAFLETRRERLIARNDVFDGPSVAQIIEEYPASWKRSSHGWHHQISTTVFWVGELPTANNPTPNTASAWDPDWVVSFGGLDHPHRRSGYAPAAFTPRQNPFYFALPYNDLDSSGRHRPEASEVIPWFWRAYKGPSISVCKDRWIAIHHKDRVCYAQWKDVGPFTTDDWMYVFQHQRPQSNRNNDAGLDVSPAVRDFLGLRGIDRVSWRFVEDHEVPTGPWMNWRASTIAADDSITP